MQISAPLCGPVNDCAGRRRKGRYSYPICWRFVFAMPYCLER